MIVHPVEVVHEGGRCRVSAKVEIETPGKTFSKTGASTQVLWFDWPEDYCSPLPDHSDAFFLVCLTLAMRLKERLEIQGCVSQSLLVNSLEAMSIYKHYFPKYCEPVDIDAQAVTRVKSDCQRVGSFYSGGVDSLYNIAESKRLSERFGVQPVTDLWLIQGMDIPLENVALWEQAKSIMFEQVQSKDNTRCVDIRSNARDIHDKYVAWTKLGFSVVLGGIAKCFAHSVPTALIGSYAKYDDIVPHASSPLVDPMWSCDQQTVRHFSCRDSRQDKINTIGEFAPHLLAGLRVCYENPENSYNCGICEKCMRTQAQLLIARRLSYVTTFENALTAENLGKLKLPDPDGSEYTWDFWRDIRIEFGKHGYADLDQALLSALKRNEPKKKRNWPPKWRKRRQV